jgi:hypothetical protein
MEYLLNSYEDITKNIKYYTLTRAFGLTEFVSIMNNL